MALADVFDQPMLTELVKRSMERRLESDPVAGERRSFFGERIAPLVTVQERATKLRVLDIKAGGLGQFKAPDATPALHKPSAELSEQIIELALLEEMERFTGEEWLKLNSSDEKLAAQALLGLTERMGVLQDRNNRLTEWMRWEAFNGELVIEYPEGGQITVDYGIPLTHKPTAATVWSDVVNSDPIEDLYAWTQIGADDAGEYYSIVHLNSSVWRFLTRNQNIQAYLSALGRQVLLPTRADLAQLMREGTSNFEIIDGGYLPEGATSGPLTKFMPDDKVMLTTRYTLDGHRIADVADGQVLVGGGNGSAPDIRQGMQSEIIVNPFSKNVFRRQASARIPRIHEPNAFLMATVD